MGGGGEGGRVGVELGMEVEGHERTGSSRFLDGASDCEFAVGCIPDPLIYILRNRDGSTPPPPHDKLTLCGQENPPGPVLVSHRICKLQQQVPKKNSDPGTQGRRVFYRDFIF